MTIKIGDYEFEGAFFSIPSLEDKTGILAILCMKGQEPQLIDIDESRAVRSRVEKHKRKECWNIHSQGGILKFAAHYTPNIKQSGRKKILKELRNKYKPPCGKN